MGELDFSLTSALWFFVCADDITASNITSITWGFFVRLVAKQCLLVYSPCFKDFSTSFLLMKTRHCKAEDFVSCTKVVLEKELARVVQHISMETYTGGICFAAVSSLLLFMCSC